MTNQVELTRASLQAAAHVLAGKGRVSMINLVRYRAEADYAGAPAREFAHLPPCSGREAYLMRYAPAFQRVAALVAPDDQAVPTFLGNVQAMLLAPAREAWDDLVIVEYPNFEALRRIVESPEYEAQAAPHRRAALAAWTFLATTKMAVPA